MKRFLIYISLTLFYTIVLSAQSDYGLRLTINDSILVLDNKKQDALKVNVTLEFTDDIDNLVLYHFNENVMPYSPFMILSPEDYTRFSTLTFFIEDKNGNLVIPNPHVLFGHIEEIPWDVYFSVDKSNLRIISNYIEDYAGCDFLNYKIGKNIMYDKKQDFILYPILYGCVPLPCYTRLARGEYYLYFFYNINWYYGDSLNKEERQCGIDVTDNGAQFLGTIQSNKVKLIVK
ncbi:MAG: hypothetical protein LBP67_00015 [Bacteroidales bacterium]|jgi:hypothetical protein|nr:hypothetical protein [Bacteroidales bacterium]